jgi:hypothetical protein
MSIEIKYFKKTGEIYRDTPFGREWDGDDGYYFNYEPDEDEFREALKQLVEEEYGEKAWALVEDFGLYDEVAAGYEEKLKDYFEEKALEGEDND